MNYLQEAFKKLEILEEESFATDKKGFGELRNFLDDTEASDDVVVIDSEAETEEDLKDSYVGKVILDCCVCHSKIYEDKEEVELDETEEWANVGKECPFCFSADGYKVIGEVAPFEEEKEKSEEEKVEVEGNEIEVKEKEEAEEKFESFKKKLRERRAIKNSGNKKPLDESKEIGDDLSEYQKWVDYDMRKYHRISKNTMNKIKAAGLSVVKDQYGDYEVIAKRPVEESVEVKATDECDVEVVKNDDGSLDVKVGSSEKCVIEDEVIVPVSDETEIEIEANSEKKPEEFEDEEIMVDMDEFEEENFDELGESYLKRVYENVESYKTTKVSSGNNKLKLEGVITFKSGNKKKTNFVFEATEMTKKNKAKFIGENQQITRGNKAFTVTGTFDGNKFLAESLNYNYRAKGTDGKSKRIYGTVSKKNK